MSADSVEIHENRLDAIVRRIEQLEAENERQAEEIEQLREENEQKDQRIDELEQQLYGTSSKVDAALAKANLNRDVIVPDDTGDQTEIEFLEEFARDGPLTERLNSKQFKQLSAIRERQMSDHSKAMRDIARVRRELNYLAEEVGVEIDAAVFDGDKITQIRSNGVASITKTAYQTDYRVEDLLNNLEDWATVRKDANGTFAHVFGPDLKEKLELLREEKLQSNQVKRVMEKVVEFAEDSPRQVKMTKTNGTRKLLVEVGEA